MVSARLAVAALSWFLTLPVTAVSSADSIGTDLTILTHDDLYGNTSTHQTAVIVLGTPQTLEIAQSSCTSIGEGLWTPISQGNITSDFSFLRYLDYDLGVVHSSVQYWIGGNSSCQVILPSGEIQTAPCDARLPALCSQTAPWSSKNTPADTASRWQVSVNTRRQTVTGYRDKLSFRFPGIKYASFPGRFEYAKYQPGTGNISALAYGPQCVQPGCVRGSQACSEDCLFLNIWTPYLPTQNTTMSKKKAVMVWVHGGGFATGSGSDTTFDGGHAAARGDVVLITINYRLSTLGFLALDNSTAKGNYGLADQITALDWIRENIAAFGGDADRITIFGQSAGAASVRALIASSEAKGKFAGAIMQSDPNGASYASTFSQYLTIAQSAARTSGILNQTGCTQQNTTAQVECLRQQDAVTLVNSNYAATYPVVDGKYLSTPQLSLNASAPKIDITVLTGIMRDDGAAFSSFYTPPASSPNLTVTEYAYQAMTSQNINASAVLSSDAFPIPSSTPNTTLNVFNLTSRVTTDAEFRCLLQATIQSAVQNHVFKQVYAYEFHRSYQIVEWSPNPPTCEAPASSEHPLGDTSLPYYNCHSGELYYVFGNLLRQGRPPRDDFDIPFSQYILDTWTSFARTADPNPDLGYLEARGYSNTTATVTGFGTWQAVNAQAPKVRILDTEVKDGGFEEVEQCIVLEYPLDYYG